MALLRLGGSTVEDRGDHLVVRTSSNPGFWWGNFLLLAEAPTPQDAPRWLTSFADEFPDSRHVAIGVAAGMDQDPGDPFAGTGLTRTLDSVLVATSVHPPPRPNTEAEYRPLAGDDDWRQHAELRAAAYDRVDDQAYQAFAEAGARSNRELVEAGHGVWMGAFVDGRLDCQMGLLRAGEGLARFQSVETRPSARGRGLAGTLTHLAGRHGFDELGAGRLVMVADPDYLAIRVYESVGFVRSQIQLGWEREPARP